MFKKKSLLFVICIAIPLIAGGIAGYITKQEIESWYVLLKKPFFNPPNFVFGPVWTTLYLLMGYSFYRIIIHPNNNDKQQSILLFSSQLILNFCWSFLFFNSHLLIVALIEMMCLWASILIMIIHYKRIDRTSAYLNIPYLIWVSFAMLLNGAIWWLNR
ncbi:MAG: TspO/MBR family protein [Bacteroidia bacterium]